MNDSVLAIIGAVVAAILTGGAMGTAMTKIAQSLVRSLIEQNKELTESIKELTQRIQQDLTVRDERDKSKFELLREVKRASEEAKSASIELSSKLRGRL